MGRLNVSNYIYEKTNHCSVYVRYKTFVADLASYKLSYILSKYVYKRPYFVVETLYCHLSNITYKSSSFSAW